MVARIRWIRPATLQVQRKAASCPLSTISVDCYSLVFANLFGVKTDAQLLSLFC